MTQRTLFGQTTVANRTLWPGDIVKLKGGPVYRDTTRFRLPGRWRVMRIDKNHRGEFVVTARQVERCGAGGKTVCGRIVTVRITGPERWSTITPHTADRPYRLVRKRRKERA